MQAALWHAWFGLVDRLHRQTWLNLLKFRLPVCKSRKARKITTRVTRIASIAVSSKSKY